MTNKQANSIGTATMLLVTIIIIYAVSCSSCAITYPFNNLKDTNNLDLSPSQLEQRNAIYPIGNDTEHIWIGGDGDTIIE